MLESLNYFFRATPDVVPPQLSTGVHLGIVFVWMTVILVMFWRSQNLKNSPKSDFYLKVIAGAILVDQVIINSWFIGHGIFTLSKQLPLFHCRMAAWMVILSVFLKKKKLVLPAIWWGLMGSVITLIISDIYPYNFPHYTNFNFVIMHLNLGWFAAYYVCAKGYKFPVSDLKKMLVITNFYNVGITVFSLVMRLLGFAETNYGYMIEPPDHLMFVRNTVGSVGYTLVVWACYNLAIFCTWLIGKHVLVAMANAREKVRIKRLSA